MIERVFNFNDLKAEDVMTPRRQVFRLDGRRLVKDALAEILVQPYSRVPLFADDPDEIVKLVFMRDLMGAVTSGNMDVPLSRIAHEPLFTPANTPTDELVRTLRIKSQHMAVVVDEHGAMVGVVTLEDLLEELVGEIYDESDIKTDEIMRLSNDRILVNGTAELRVVEEFFDIDLPGKPTDTINRWLLEHTERIPVKDERFELDGLDIRVQDASSRRIHQVILQKVSKDNQGDGNNVKLVED
jgi:putative hemolysin